MRFAILLLAIPVLAQQPVQPSKPDIPTAKPAEAPRPEPVSVVTARKIGATIRAELARPSQLQRRLQLREERISRWFGDPDPRTGLRQPKGHLVKAGQIAWVSRPRPLVAWAQEIPFQPSNSEEPQPSPYLVLVFRNEQAWRTYGKEIAVTPEGIIVWARETPQGFDFDATEPTGSVPVVSADGRRALCWIAGQEDRDWFASYFAEQIDSGDILLLGSLPGDWRPVEGNNGQP